MAIRNVLVLGSRNQRRAVREGWSEDASGCDYSVGEISTEKWRRVCFSLVTQWSADVSALGAI